MTPRRNPRTLVVCTNEEHPGTRPLPSLVVCLCRRLPADVPVPQGLVPEKGRVAEQVAKIGKQPEGQ